ncbi:hypothetical protein [Pseudogracilibacillus sp. ICA-222130]|uniref:hypothetical protein n=1 Tax=Pseudogracilibacillus sp. ICA-222130 TaxID=3134655 RepID=UPI0030C4F17A
MGKIFYIELMVSGEDRREWIFDSLESRNKAFDQVKEKFKKDTSIEIPFIELDVGIWINDRSDKVTRPFGLSPEVKTEVIKYLDSL